MDMGYLAKIIKIFRLENIKRIVSILLIFGSYIDNLYGESCYIEEDDLSCLSTIIIESNSIKFAGDYGIYMNDIKKVDHILMKGDVLISIDGCSLKSLQPSTAHREKIIVAAVGSGFRECKTMKEMKIFRNGVLHIYRKTFFGIREIIEICGNECLRLEKILLKIHSDKIKD
ncbi:hypothetical protein EFP84_13565 [Leptospira kmetyi]|uniref:Uncharacterized protein n=1 Tax=Leptospira kmetyi TaxID=408139 RepID=A0AAD0UQ19_9LEPT|nr:hypothetical protein [Leptospira kmetyi]AYV56432.1 hypothetical protein EFP84_13565 [Leptospira kmetyi]